MNVALAYALVLGTTLVSELVGQSLLVIASLSIVGAFGRAEHRAMAVASAGTVLLAAALAKLIFLMCAVDFGLGALLLASLPHTAIATGRYVRHQLKIDRSASLGALAALVALLAAHFIWF